MHRQKEQGYIYVSIISALLLIVVFIAQDPTRVSTDIPDIVKNDQPPLSGLAIVDQPVVTGEVVQNQLSGEQHLVAIQTGEVQTGQIQTGFVETGTFPGTITGESLSGTLTGDMFSENIQT